MHVTIVCFGEKISEDFEEFVIRHVVAHEGSVAVVDIVPVDVAQIEASVHFVEFAPELFEGFFRALLGGRAPESEESRCEKEE
jgi:hypothetical protein